jgi:hypothetical protein
MKTKIIPTLIKHCQAGDPECRLDYRLEVNGIRMHAAVEVLNRELSAPRTMADFEKDLFGGGYAGSHLCIYGRASHNGSSTEPSTTYLVAYDGGRTSFECNDEERHKLIEDLKTCPTIVVDNDNYRPPLPSALIDPKLEIGNPTKISINGVSMPIPGADYFSRVLRHELDATPDDAPPDENYYDGWGCAKRMTASIYFEIYNIDFLLSVEAAERLLDLLQALLRRQSAPVESADSKGVRTDLVPDFLAEIYPEGLPEHLKGS